MSKDALTIYHAALLFAILGAQPHGDDTVLLAKAPLTKYRHQK